MAPKLDVNVGRTGHSFDYISYIYLTSNRGCATNRAWNAKLGLFDIVNMGVRSDVAALIRAPRARQPRVRALARVSKGRERRRRPRVRFGETNPRCERATGRNAGRAATA